MMYIISIFHDVIIPPDLGIYSLCRPVPQDGVVFVYNCHGNISRSGIKILKEIACMFCDISST